MTDLFVDDHGYTNTTTNTTMDYALSIKVTEKQYHVLKMMAKAEYRTLGNMVGALIAEGIQFYLTERSICVRKMEEDCTTENPNYEYYKDAEIIDALITIPVLQ
jgi:hypothetical protein